MIEFYINIAYCRNYENLIRTKDNEKELSPQTNALFFLMFACGIYRLFDRSALYELLTRMAIIFKHQSIVDNFFLNDSLFVIKTESYRYTMTMKDMEDHLGLEIANAPDDLIARVEWLKNIRKHWKAANIVGVFGNNPMIEKTTIDRNVYQISIHPDMEINREYQNSIELFATEALKSIPEVSFKDLQYRVAEVRQNLSKYRKRLKKKPRHEFNYSIIPRGTKAKICDACFGYIKNKEEMYNEPVFISLCYLAWLWANNYVVEYRLEMDSKKAYTAEVDPRMPFNYEDYDGLNSLEFGINIYDTFYDFNLDKVSHLLKEKQSNPK